MALIQFRSIYRHHHYATRVANRRKAQAVDIVPGGERTIRKSGVEARSPRKLPPTAFGRLLLRVTDMLLVAYEWKTEHQFLGRYSVDKLVRFDQYCRSTSRTRVVAVVCLSPLPVVVAVLAFQAVPLPDPALGPAKSWLFFLWSMCAHTILSLMTLFPFKQALRLTDTVFPLRTMAAIACFVGLTNELLFAIPAFTWQYPVPYRELIAGATWPVFVAIGTLVFARKAIISKWGRVKKYLPIAGTQFVFFFAFLGLAVVFAHLPPKVQIAWIVGFPFFKIAVKKWLWQYSRRLEDISTDVTVCLVEISGALYQSVCMQLMESLTAAVLLMAMDFVQAVIEVWMYMNHGFVVDGPATVDTAVKIVESSLFPGVTESRASSSSGQAPHPSAASWATTLSSSWSSRRGSITRSSNKVGSTHSQADATARTGRRESCTNGYVARAPHSVFLFPADFEKRAFSRRRLLNLRRHSVIRSQTRQNDSRASTPLAAKNSDDISARFSGAVTTGKPLSSVQIDNIDVPRKDQARILEQSLQLLFSCEVLIFVEYIEVIVPLIYTVIATATWHLPNAKYNTVICWLSREQMLQGFKYSVLYATLELGTFVVMCVAMRRKYGVHTFYQLAFVLETYAMTVQGKLIGCFIVIVNLAIVHQGVDMTFVMNGEETMGGCATGSAHSR